MGKKNVVLLECSGKCWIEIIANLQTYDPEIVPVYWSAWRHLQKDIAEVYPHTLVHDVADAKRNIFPSELDHLKHKEFDSICQEVWNEEAQTVYDMLNRFDHSRDFSFIERQHYFYEALIYWNALLNHYNPELVVFPCPPHVTYDYIVLALCRKKGVKTIMFDEATIFPPYCFAMSDYIDDATSLGRNYRASLMAGAKFNVEESILNEIKKIRTTYKEAKPYREVIAHQSLHKRTVRQRLLEWKLIAFAFIDDLFKLSISSRFYVINDAAVIKQKDVSLRASFRERFSMTKFLIQRTCEMNVSERQFDLYHSLCSNVDISKKYIYLSLSGQPERTSNPQGDEFSYQILMANILANAIPDDWVLYIKEHPNQFHPKMYVNLYRNAEYYSLLAQHPKIKLIPTNADPFEMLDNSMAVATISGTTGLEAIIRGKHVLIFGHPWYVEAPGVMRVKCFEDAQRAIVKLKEGVAIAEQELLRFFSCIPTTAFKGLGDPLPDHYGVSSEENAKSIAEAVIKVLNGVQL